jgi:Flp pilus assembly protein TadD
LAQPRSPDSIGIELIIWMLYNVLPPLIFFISLGGTILVVSRVVLRVRRDVVATELQSHVYQVSKSRLHKVQDLAGILAPNHISVQNFKNRITYIAHSIKENVVKAVSDAKGWRKNKIEVRQKTKDEKKAMKMSSEAKPVIEPVVGVAGITPPTDRIRNPFKKLVTQAKGVSTRSGGALKRYTAEAAISLKNKTSKNEIQSKENIVVKSELSKEKKKTVAISSEKMPVMKIAQKDNESAEDQLQGKAKISLKKEEQDTAKGIGKFFKKEQGKSALEQAKEALAQAEVQKVEDILVPYIVEHPKDMAAYMMLGKAAISLENWTEAAEIFEQVTHMKPETKGCYAALGEAAYESGNLTKAIEALQRAHDQNPKDVRVIKRLIKIAGRLDNQPMERSLVEELETLEKETVTKDKVV